MRVVDIEIAQTEVLGEGGFCRLRRCQARNVLSDGDRSATYALDVVERPAGVDAVAVLPYDPGPPVRVALRRGMRPALRLGRPDGRTREGRQVELTHVELVAGILERGDEGEDGLARRAVAELREEIGLSVAPGAIEALGRPVVLYPGLIAERLYVCRVAASLDHMEQPDGDGSPLEQGGAAVVLELDRALEQCQHGPLEDARTELALRRLAEALAREGAR